MCPKELVAGVSETYVDGTDRRALHPEERLVSMAVSFRAFRAASYIGVAAKREQSS